MDHLLPNLIIHADWSMHASKRWMTSTRLQTDGSYLATPPQQVPDLQFFLKDIQADIEKKENALIGFDFSIGLPIAYAKRVGITNFIDALKLFGLGNWKDFYKPANSADQISLYRPFYPNKPGGTKQSHLITGLGLNDIHQLHRQCEQATSTRRATAPTFWTLGAQQVGKATIAGWRDLLAPALANPDLHLSIWPFDGGMSELTQPGKITAVEAYPAEYYQPLEIAFRRKSDGRRAGKKDHASRQENGEKLLKAARSVSLTLPEELIQLIRTGFGESKNADDCFDSMVGLLGMMKTIRGQLPTNVPIPPGIARVEGWIFGQSAL